MRKSFIISEMKNVIFIKLCVLLIAAVFTFVACDKEEGTKDIIVQNGSSQTQVVFADEEQGNSGVSFTTTGPWTSSISTVMPSVQSTQLRATSETTPAESTPDWISISPNAGKAAGDYTIEISLLPNTTGVDRMAVIAILCNGTEMTITVTQKREKEDGTLPEEPKEEPQESGNMPKVLQDALSNFLKENNEIFIDNTYKQYNYNISMWEERRYILAFNGENKKIYQKGFFEDYRGNAYETYIEENTAYITYIDKKQSFHTVTDNIWETNTISYYMETIVDLVSDYRVGLENHVWTINGNVYTGKYFHDDITDEINITLTNGKITAIKSDRTPSAVAPYIYQNDMSIGYSVNPTLVAAISKSEFTPVSQYMATVNWGENLGETVFYTGLSDVQSSHTHFGFYIESAYAITPEAIQFFAPSVEGKKITGYYKDADFTVTDDFYVALFYGKPLYIDNNVMIYVKWENE